MPTTPPMINLPTQLAEALRMSRSMIPLIRLALRRLLQASGKARIIGSGDMRRNKRGMGTEARGAAH
jgi:hypothetical protein